jgi:hypothetical protein
MMTHDQCVFPLFRSRYLGGARPYVPDISNVETRRDQGDNANCSDSNPSSTGLALGGGPAKLGRLDLRALAREDGEPTEVGARRHKMAAFEKKCSEVIDKLFISGEFVAKHRPTIQANRITHVINCVAALYPPFHQEICTYKNFFLNGVSSSVFTLGGTCEGHLCLPMRKAMWRRPRP